MNFLAVASLIPVLTLSTANATPAAPPSGSPAVTAPPPGAAETRAADEAEPETAATAAAAPVSGGNDDGEDSDSAPEEAEDVENASAELEALKALEAVSLDSSAQAGAELLQTLHRLGPAHPLRQRLAEALADGEWRAGAELLQVTDLASFNVELIRGAYDIPIEMQPLVAQYIQFFRGPGRSWFRKWLSRSTRYLPMMQSILEESGVPRDTVYLAMIESGFSAHAYSWAHASGPWQFISETGKQYGLKQDFWVDERRDPIKSTHAAAKFLRHLHKQFGHWYLAWAGYNTGPGRVRRLVEKLGTSDFWLLSEGKGLAKETKHYVPKLIAAAIVAKHHQAFGFTHEELQFEAPLAYEEVPLTHATDLEVIARGAGITAEAIRDLNPELKRWCTPPAHEDSPYLLRVPPGTKAQLEEALAKLPASQRLNFLVHRVKRGDTLSAIAVKHGSAAEAVMRLNNLKNARALRVGAELVIPVPPKGGKLETAQARRSGFVHRPEEEIPAGTKSSPSQGTVLTQQVDGRLRVTYGVASGDTLWDLSQRFDCTVEDIRRWNGLGGRRAKRLQLGQALTLWPGKHFDATKLSSGGGTASTQAASTHGRAAPAPQKPAQSAAPPRGSVGVHVLASGETLWAVAQRYGVAVNDLMRWNGIQNSRALRAGQRLVLASP